MLTRDDRTVADCLDVFAAIRPVGLEHVGFKDIGVDRPTLARLNDAIRAGGATSYMEVVSTSPETALESARTAVEIGVDRLMGGTDVDEVLAILRGSDIEYYPFPGTPRGHPTDLYGTPEQVAGQCREFMGKGCAGVDLLAYRAAESEPLALVEAARDGIGRCGRLICAGSVDSPRRIDALAAAGCDAFTIGSAAFNGAFSPRKGLLVNQLHDIAAAARPR